MTEVQVNKKQGMSFPFNYTNRNSMGCYWKPRQSNWGHFAKLQIKVLLPSLFLVVERAPS